LKHDDLDKRVSAHFDGALRGAKRDQFERELGSDPRLAEQVARTRGLSRLVREAWTEGPAAPPPDFVIAAIRPALFEIDRERRMRPAWQRTLESLAARLTSALRPSPALAAAAAFAFVAALAIVPSLNVGNGLLSGSVLGPAQDAAAPASLQPFPTSSSGSALGLSTQPTDFTAEGSGSVYDVAPGRPAVLFHGRDGTVTLWLIDDGDMSLRTGAGGWG
jgi:anti-sigma factor RsiW